jgi:hypothetical protein
MTTITDTMPDLHSSQWTPGERAREERACAVRARRDLEKTLEERLEETLRLSRLMSELRQGAVRDVRAR